MVRNLLDLRPDYDPLTGKPLKPKRKNFTEATKKAALIKAKGKCMSCGEKLNPRSTEFDHKDNNPSNNSLSNCMVVCSNCHREHTVIAKRKVKDILGNVIGSKTIKKRVGYKKQKTKKKKKVKKKDSLFDIW